MNEKYSAQPIDLEQGTTTADMVPVPLFDRLKTDNFRGVPGTGGVLIYKIREAIQC